MVKAIVVFIFSLVLLCSNVYAGEEGVYSLQVRGVVKALPGPGIAANEILVKHEPIPDYRDESGNVVGMMAMTMPFYLAKSVSLDGIAVGDVVEMVVEQRIKPKFSDSVVAIKEIAAVK